MRGWSSGNTMGKSNIVNLIVGNIIWGCQMIQLEIGYMYQKVISTPFVSLISASMHGSFEILVPSSLNIAMIIRGKYKNFKFRCMEAEITINRKLK